MEDQPRKKIMGRFEWFSLIVAMGIIGYIVLAKFGIHVVEQTESIEIVDKPSRNKNARNVRQYEGVTKHSDTEVEYMLREVAAQFSNGKNEVSTDLHGLSRDELKYLNEVKKKNSSYDSSYSTRDWFSILQTSYSTYSKLKSIFNEPTNAADIKKEMKDKERANTIYDQLSNVFNISKEEAKSFARKGGESLSDWASFVEENRRD